MEKLYFRTPEEYFKEAIRYYRNARNDLKQAKVLYGRYQDLKPVRKACGIAYLSVLLALDGYFVKRGIDKEKLPNSVDEYYDNMKKYLVHNGRITNAFFNVYELLHIWGYYRGIGDPDITKKGFETAKLIIQTITGIKM